jgi:hypothetical protein
MFSQIRIADGFSLQSAEQLVATGCAIIKGLTGNDAFPAPAVDLKTVKSAVDDLSAALAAQAQGGTAATSDQNNKRAILVAHLRTLKHYVEDNCRSNLAALMSSGFQAAVRTRTRTPLTNPSILDIRYGNSAELVLHVSPIAHAKCYEVRSATMGAGNAPGPWQAAGMFTNSRSMIINGLTPGATYVFQVRAIGESTGYSDWSNPMSRMCA